MVKPAESAWVASHEATAAAYLAKAKKEDGSSQLNELLNQLSDIRQECRAQAEVDGPGQVNDLGEKVWGTMCEVAGKMEKRLDVEDGLIRAGLLTREDSEGPSRQRQHRGFREAIREVWRRYVMRVGK